MWVGQSVDVCHSHKHALLEREYQCFSVEGGDRGCLCATGSSSSIAQGTSRRCSDRTAGFPGAHHSIHPVPYPQCVRDLWASRWWRRPWGPPQFPQGAPGGAPVRVCDGGSCVQVVLRLHTQKFNILLSLHNFFLFITLMLHTTILQFNPFA